MIVFMAFTPMHSPTGKGYYLHFTVESTEVRDGAKFEPDNEFRA